MFGEYCNELVNSVSGDNMKKIRYFESISLFLFDTMNYASRNSAYRNWEEQIETCNGYLDLKRYGYSYSVGLVLQYKVGICGDVLPAAAGSVGLQLEFVLIGHSIVFLFREREEFTDLLWKTS